MGLLIHGIEVYRCKYRSLRNPVYRYIIQHLLAWRLLAHFSPRVSPSYPFSPQPSMQRPTCTMLRVRSTAEAHVIFHAVSLNLLPIVSRRLDTEERRHISSGCVFVWEERGSNAEATGLGIERWTDSIRWGPSRVKDEFLFYHEKEPEPAEIELTASDSDGTASPHTYSRGLYRENLVKQTYSVFVDTRRGRRKWHLIAYFTQNSLPYLKTIHDIPGLANLHVPPGKYKSARSAKGRPRDSYDPFQANPWTGVSPQASYTAYPQTSPNSLTIPLLTGPPPDYHSESPTNGPKSPNNRSRSSPEKILAPLAYLENIPPPRRHPLDEEALMSFSGA
ncbi:hypothetical protein D9758_006391 [Tetrapyrgos nigripes]|uniref:cAMP-independent regulatory protein pac2 n=1 Tax=Tetrapyrgos nigripes TaxID=182062 RepID=A0A8H5DAT3_9AGAR|nr:hypothetical protein D9758_006391 [Tetrapyrgos nigripes]